MSNATIMSRICKINLVDTPMIFFLHQINSMLVNLGFENGEKICAKCKLDVPKNDKMERPGAESALPLSSLGVRDTTIKFLVAKVCFSSSLVVLFFSAFFAEK